MFVIYSSEVISSAFELSGYTLVPSTRFTICLYRSIGSIGFIGSPLPNVSIYLSNIVFFSVTYYLDCFICPNAQRLHLNPPEEYLPLCFDKQDGHTLNPHLSHINQFQVSGSSLPQCWHAIRKLIYPNINR